MVNLVISPVDIEAAERMGELHDALKECGYTGHDLEIYLVRLLYGGLFEERLETASFDSSMRKILLKCCSLDWSKIKPEIFGALFQSIKDKEKRRALDNMKCLP